MKQSDVKIAVTGGIGSGKSTVCAIIGALGYPVFSCDGIYSDLVRDRKFVAGLAAEFGDKIVSSDGSLDRKKLAEEVFGNAEKLERLNAITHPAIFKEMFSRSAGKGLCFFEVPLLFEGGYQPYFDGIVVVLRRKEERIAEVMRRDGLSREEVERRIAKQFDYDSGSFDGCTVIENGGDICKLRGKVEKVVANILSKK